MQAYNHDSALIGLKRSCDSPLDSCNASSHKCSQTDQEWDSPIEDVDLSSSDSLEEDLEFGASSKEISPASSTQSEGNEHPNINTPSLVVRGIAQITAWVSLDKRVERFQDQTNHCSCIAGWTFLGAHPHSKNCKSLQLAGLAEEPKNMTSSPTKTGQAPSILKIVQQRGTRTCCGVLLEHQTVYCPLPLVMMPSRATFKIKS